MNRLALEGAIWVPIVIPLKLKVMFGVKGEIVWLRINWVSMIRN